MLDVLVFVFVQVSAGCHTAMDVTQIGSHVLCLCLCLCTHLCDVIAAFVVNLDPNSLDVRYVVSLQQFFCVLWFHCIIAFR